MRTRTLGQILERDQNNFNLLRLLAACAVLLSHAIFLRTGSKSDEIFASISYYNLGDHAVNVFFVLSGITICASLDRSRSFLEFLTGRILRIFPGLAICTFALVFAGMVIAACRPADYLSDVRVLSYIVQTLSLSSGAAVLPGVFEANPHPFVVNAPTWTLKYEVICYLLLCILSVAGLSRKHVLGWIALGSIAFAAALFLSRTGSTASSFEQLARLWMCFSVGSGMYAFRHQLRLSGLWVGAAAVMVWVSLGSPLERVVSPISVGYASIWIASFPVGKLRQLTNKIDLSYGIYIFGWPITQIIIHLWPQATIAAVQVAALALAACVAMVSWITIERPALKAKVRVITAFRAAAFATLLARTAEPYPLKPGLR